jgi:hypothetical protein
VVAPRWRALTCCVWWRELPFCCCCCLLLICFAGLLCEVDIASEPQQCGDDIICGCFVGSTYKTVLQLLGPLQGATWSGNAPANAVAVAAVCPAEACEGQDISSTMLAAPFSWSLWVCHKINAGRLTQSGLIIVRVDPGQALVCYVGCSLCVKDSSLI